MHVAPGRAQDIVRGQQSEIGGEVVARAGLADQGAIGAGKAVGNEPVIRQRIDKALQPDAVAALERARQLDVAGMGDSVGEIDARREIDGARAYVGAADTGIQRVRRIRAGAATGQGNIERLEIGIEGIGIAAKFIERQPSVAVGIPEGRIAARNVSAAIDQRLRQAVPARRLHIAVGMVIHVIGRQRPVGQGKVARQFQQLMAGMNAAIEAEGIVDLAIGMDAALDRA